MKRLLLLLLLVATPAFSQQCRPFVGTAGGVSLVGSGYAKYLPTTAKMLTDTPTAGVAIPTIAREGVIFVNTQAIRYRTDGTNPTASSGVLVQPGTALVFDDKHGGQLRQFRFIEVTSGAEVTVSYCW